MKLSDRFALQGSDKHTGDETGPSMNTGSFLDVVIEAKRKACTVSE